MIINVNDLFLDIYVATLVIYGVVLTSMYVISLHIHSST